MNKRKESNAAVYLRSVSLGAVGVVLFFALVLAAAGLGETETRIMEWKTPLTKAFLFIGAAACGMLAGRRAERGRLLHAFLSELPLLTALAVCVLSSASEPRFSSIAVDLLLLLFGAFAGTLLCGNRRIQRRGKR